MGFRKHSTAKCHTCKRRQALGGTKHTSDHATAKRAGWRFVFGKRLGDWVWLCPACARKRITKPRTADV